MAPCGGGVLVCSTFLILGLRLKGTISQGDGKGQRLFRKRYVSRGLGSELWHPSCLRSIGQGEPHAQGRSQQVEKYTFAYKTKGQRMWMEAAVKN